MTEEDDGDEEEGEDEVREEGVKVAAVEGKCNLDGLWKILLQQFKQIFFSNPAAPTPPPPPPQAALFPTSHPQNLSSWQTSMAMAPCHVYPFDNNWLRPQGSTAAIMFLNLSMSPFLMRLNLLHPGALLQKALDAIPMHKKWRI